MQHITHTNTYLAHIKGIRAMGRFELASALTIDCPTGLCFYGHPDTYRVQSKLFI